MVSSLCFVYHANDIRVLNLGENLQLCLQVLQCDLSDPFPLDLFAGEHFFCRLVMTAEHLCENSLANLFVKSIALYRFHCFL